MTGERISDVQICTDMTIEIFQMQDQKEGKKIETAHRELWNN